MHTQEEMIEKLFTENDLSDLFEFITQEYNNLNSTDAVEPQMEEKFSNTKDEKQYKSNIYKIDETLIVELALPGFISNEINVYLDDKLTITGKKDNELDGFDIIEQNIPCSDFSYDIIMPNSYLYGDMTASFNNGILKLLITPSKSKKTVTIQ